MMLLAIPHGVSGFGRNKVRYEQLEWQYLATPHSHIFTHSGQGTLPSVASEIVGRCYAQLEQQFGYTHRKPVPVIVYGSASLFAQTNVISSVIPEGVGGFTELFKNRVVVPWTGAYREFRHVVHHELVHALEFGVLYERFGGSFLRNAGMRMPLWFAEGLAEYLSSDWDRQADMFMIDRMVNAHVPLPGPELGGYMAYKGGQSFFHFLATTRGDSLFTELLHAFRELRAVEPAFEKAYGTTIEKLGTEWQQQLKRLYWPEIAIRTEPDRLSKKLTQKRFKRATYNLKPRVSPDGDKIAFFSDVGDFTRIYVTDIDGKEVLARISQHGSGGFFESFHPFRSGVCWAPDGERLAFVTERSGTDEIRIVDITDASAPTTLHFPSLRSLASPTWSPDGTRLVFTATTKHESDLYQYTFSDSSLRRLTHDMAYETSPRFSPDGRRLVYAIEHAPAPSVPHPDATDLAIMELGTGEVRQLCETPWSEREPCFASTDSTFVFVSDRNGINNLYHAHLDSLENARPLTDFIGASSSPDWCRATNTVAFTLFEKGKWHIRRIDSPLADTTIGIPLKPTRWVQHLQDSSQPFYQPPPPPDDSTAAAVDTSTADSVHATDETQSAITTAAPSEPSVLDSLTTPSASTPDSTATVDTVGGPYPYRLRFSPDLITVGLGVSSVYGYAGQWHVVMSDLMGDHRFAFAGDLQGRLDEYMHLFGSYLNSKYRIAFGLGGFYGRHYTLLGSLYHDTNIGGMLLLRYPFSVRARLQLDAYYSHVTREAMRTSGQSSSFDILLPSLSYVYDRTVWGLTGPVNGTRAQAALTVVPPLASLDAAFGALELDYRRYFHIARKFVLATRVSAGAALPFDSNKRTRQYLLGGTAHWFNYQLDVDGYYESLDDIFYSDMVVPFRGWYYYDITGERYAVANIEFRFPFIKEISTVWPLPLRLRYINGAVFADIGNAWDPQDQYPNIPLPRDIYGGIGFGVRANLGIFVLRYDRAWRTDWQTFVNRPVNYWSLGGDF